MHNPFAGFFARWRTQNAAVSGAPSFHMGLSGAGKAVNERSAMQLTTVYACVRIIAETVASLPLNVYKAEERGKTKAIEHPLQFILHDAPNEEMTSFALRETIMTHLLLWGNAYLQIIRNGAGRVVALYPLLPDRMQVDRDGEGRLRYTYNAQDGAHIMRRGEDVLHIPGMGFDGIMGHSPVAMAKNALGLSIAAEEYGSKFFANGARPSGVLTHPAQIKDKEGLKRSWNAAYGGSGNSGRVAVLEEGMEYKTISMPNNEAQFLETRKFQIEEICRIYRVPPHMVAEMSNATFSNIEHQSINFGVHTIRPWLVRLEQAINRDLFPGWERGKYFAAFNMDGLLRGDYNSRMQGYAVGIQNGFMSPNDVRELENMNPIPPEKGGDTYAMNGNMLPLEKIGAYAEGGEES